jgi:hypothetical protein
MLDEKNFDPERSHSGVVFMVMIITYQKLDCLPPSIVCYLPAYDIINALYEKKFKLLRQK